MLDLQVLLRVHGLSWRFGTHVSFKERPLLLILRSLQDGLTVIMRSSTVTVEGSSFRARGLVFSGSYEQASSRGRGSILGDRSWIWVAVAGS